MKRAVLFGVLFVLVAAAGFAQSGLDFDPGSTIVRSGIAELVTVTQVVGTPTPDVIARSVFDLQVFDGDLPASGAVAVIAGTMIPQDVLVLDIDGDGDMDIVDARPNFSIRLHSQNAGSFTTQSYSIAISGEGRLRSGDLNVDGLVDFTIGRAVVLGMAGGTYLVVPFTLSPSGSTELDLLEADFDGDGDDDVLVTFVLPGQTAVTSQILRRTASGSLDPRPTQTFVVSSETLIDVCVTDLDGNGRQDVLVASIHDDSRVLRIKRLEAPSANTFATLQNTHLGTSFGAFETPEWGRLVVRDLDVDGDAEIVLRAREESCPWFGIMFQGQSGGGFVPHPGFGLSLQPDVSETYLDIDQNGSVEMVYAESDTGLLRAVSAGSLAWSPSIAMTSNSVQAATLVSFPSPIYFVGSTATVFTGWRALLPIGTIPVRGRVFSRSLTSIGGPAALLEPSSAVDTVSGQGGILRTVVYGGPTSSVASLTVEGLAVQTLRFGGQLEIVGSDVAIVDPCTMPSLNVVVRATDASGLPLQNVLVTLNEFANGSINWNTQFIHTNAQGEAAYASQGVSTLPSALTFHFTSGVGSTTFTVVPSSGLPMPMLEKLGGDGQIANHGSPFPAPFVVRLTNGQGQPMSGVQIMFAVSGAATPTSPTSVITDAAGTAQLSASAFGTGQATIGASALFLPCISPPPPVSFTAFTRRLAVARSGSVLVATLRLEHGGVPLLFAADVPQAPMPTLFGTIHTSILAPGPAFGSIDGLGLFGPADPTLLTSTTGNWSRFFNVGPAVLGTTVVFQVYGIDLAYPFPATFVVSNPAMATL